jgi:hypothetical protein
MHLLSCSNCKCICGKIGNVIFYYKRLINPILRYGISLIAFLTHTQIVISCSLTFLNPYTSNMSNTHICNDIELPLNIIIRYE